MSLSASPVPGPALLAVSLAAMTLLAPLVGSSIAIARCGFVCVLICSSFTSPCQAAGDPLEEAERQLETATKTDSHGAHQQVPPPARITHLKPDPHVHPDPHVAHADHALFEAFGLPFMRRAMLAGVLAGGLCAWLGVFVVLRRLAFVAVALAQVASAGIAASVLLGLDPVAGGMVATILAALLTGSRETRGGLPGEARMGLTYIVAGSLAVLCLAKSATGEAEQLEMLQGNLLIVSDYKIGLLVVTGVGLALFHFIGWSRLVAVAFDPASAAVEGVRVAAWDAAFFLALGTGIGVSVQSAGLLLVFTYLLVPPCIGLAAGFRLPGMLAVGLVSQAMATLVGLWIAYDHDLPGGPAIALVLVGLLAIVSLLRWSSGPGR